jgi:hypothetical protein
MCLDCGFYNGKMIVDMKAKKDARDARMQTKKDAIRSQRGAEEVATTVDTKAVVEAK